MLTTLLTIGAGVATISLLSAAGDAFSTWILDQAATTGSTPTQALAQLGSFAALQATAGPGLIILLSVLAIIGMVVQLAMVLIRSALLVVLVGVWPLAAASSMTEMGRQWYKKITGWLVAFLLFKPAAAIVYAAAIKMTLSSDSELASIEGIVLIILASLTLPALMKFVVPAVSSVGSMGAGEVLGAGIAAATGAAMVIGTAGVGAAAAGGAAAGSAGGGAAAGAAGGAAGAVPAEVESAAVPPVRLRRVGVLLAVVPNRAAWGRLALNRRVLDRPAQVRAPFPLRHPQGRARRDRVVPKCRSVPAGRGDAAWWWRRPGHRG